MTLAATLPAANLVPVGALTQLLGVDRFMADICAATNLTSKVVATPVVARWAVRSITIMPDACCRANATIKIRRPGGRASSLIETIPLGAALPARSAMTPPRRKHVAARAIASRPYRASRRSASHLQSPLIYLNAHCCVGQLPDRVARPDSRRGARDA